MPTPDYILDVSSLKPPGDAAERADAAADQSLRGRPWLAIHWRCCSTYSRIYRSPDATVYEGCCPHCRRPLRIAVGEGGTNSRFFEAS